ncbi:response regulator transcription factor [Levilactobacillus zymae]|uniref:DNA-binding response regulator n=1 Tax=Levilactobacillus zymae TaxID=267363 RepID=A0A1Y6JZ00_9LACO|nr:response regulator transcription factor [Levilactobacillus zymae]KRL16370.1 response regulator [Levilactobacillus zymae DSM 19395]QFR62371.1 response regulator [Levilactobacillus zymae]GEO73196.1 DNA-binding response regulator [Levilactobacillus zymae]SMS15020.1 Two-component system regulator llrE [Levilactobacillus zymae]
MSHTILIVEDEEAVITYLTSELQFEGYTVLNATDGPAALATYESHRGQLDLILLDWMLPGLDGLEVLRRIRKRDDLPVIMMTARDYVGDKVAGLDTGADDYITKPFDIEELLARIRVILRHQRGQQRQPQQLRVADLTLDTAARQVLRHNGIIQLTQREYDLLLCLMQHAGQTLTRDELLDTVWGVDFDGQPNIVDVYIRYLRHKVDLVTPHLIHTVRGVGYVLSADYR